MRRGRTCCVPNCKDMDNKRHRFPLNQPEVFAIWVKRIQHPRFKSISYKNIYKSYYICHKHFAPECHVVGTRRGLKVGSLPTKYLSEFYEISNIKNIVNSKQDEQNTFKDKNNLIIENKLYQDDDQCVSDQEDTNGTLQELFMDLEPPEEASILEMKNKMNCESTVDVNYEDKDFIKSLIHNMKLLSREEKLSFQNEINIMIHNRTKTVNQLENFVK